MSSHPSICAIYGYGSNDASSYLKTGAIKPCVFCASLSSRARTQLFARARADTAKVTARNSWNPSDARPIVPCLPGLDEDNEHIKPIAGRRVALRVH